MARYKIWKSIYAPWGRWVILGTTIYGGIGIVRSEIISGLPTVANVIPRLPYWAWVLIIMGVLLMLTLEGAYRLFRKKHNTWIDNLYYDKGTEAILPKYLAGLFIDTNTNKTAIAGTIVSHKLKPIHPSKQHWNRLIPTQKKEWRQLVSWLGENPDDYIARMNMVR